MRKVATIGVIVLVSAVIAELFLHLASRVSGEARWALAAPWERTEYVYDAALQFRGNPDHPEHDRLGFRNRQVPERVDIATTGDSQSYGIGVAAGEEWPQRLHDFTGQSVYNLSMSGWGPVQYLSIVDQALRLRPRIFAVGLHLGNDIFDSYTQTYEAEIGAPLRDPAVTPLMNELQANPPQSFSLDEASRIAQEAKGAANTAVHPLRAFIANHSKLYALARGFRYLLLGYDLGFQIWTTEFRDDYWLRLKQLAAKFPDQMIALETENARTILGAHYRIAAIDLDDARIAEGMEVSLRVLERMQERCREEDVTLLVALLPTKETTFAPFRSSANASEEAEKMSKRLTRFETEVRKRLFGFFEEKGIAYVDVLPALRSAVADQLGNPYFESTNGHYSALGQEVIARTIAAHPLISGESDRLVRAANE